MCIIISLRLHYLDHFNKVLEIVNNMENVGNIDNIEDDAIIQESQNVNQRYISVSGNIL